MAPVNSGKRCTVKTTYSSIPDSKCIKVVFDCGDIGSQCGNIGSQCSDIGWYTS